MATTEKLIKSIVRTKKIKIVTGSMQCSVGFLMLSTLYILTTNPESIESVIILHPYKPIVLYLLTLFTFSTLANGLSLIASACQRPR
ncbi:hypothetical protein DRO02_05260 [archaeon]|nr:MAG: hypothetical protein DRO02_05260 [archaeon]RLG64875.1 MAG: hypothetical protein DRO21_03140 [archaeon]HDM23430.1 hypothetical protein [Candidatus Bathyarchaeota archaeon]